MKMASKKLDTTMENKCGKCKLTVKAKDNGLLCEYCAQWFHSICEKESEERYKALTKSGDQTHWFCKACNDKVMMTLRFVQNVKEENDKIKQEISAIKEEVNKMKKDSEIQFEETRKDLSDRPTFKELENLMEEKLSNIPEGSTGKSSGTEQVAAVMNEIGERKILESLDLN